MSGGIGGRIGPISACAKRPAFAPEQGHMSYFALLEAEKCFAGRVGVPTDPVARFQSRQNDRGDHTIVFGAD
jgi:hypothetical protein